MIVHKQKTKHGTIGFALCLIVFIAFVLTFFFLVSDSLAEVVDIIITTLNKKGV